MFITWGLHGSLPAGRKFPEATTSGQAFLLMDRLLADAANGPRYMCRPEIASVVVEAVRYRDPAEYDLHHFVVMPNHVHILVTPRMPVSKVMQSLKRFTARECNRILGMTGQPFWQVESYDRLVRDDREFEQIARYIEMNPVAAGLVAEPHRFPWSSAWRKAEEAD
jgi:REP element-mobilizing transposase RayT